MGLPIFITPIEPEVPSKATDKVASEQRSSIRRHRPIRGPHARLTAESRRRRLGMLPLDRNSEQHEVRESQNGPRTSQSDVLPGATLQSRAIRLFEQERQQERMRLRDVFSFEREQPPSTDLDGPLMPPVPEPGNLSRYIDIGEQRQREIQRLRQIRQDVRRLARRQPAPTPPYTDSDLALMARTGTDSSHISMTPEFLSSHRPVDGVEGAPRRILEDVDSAVDARRGHFTVVLDHGGGSSSSLIESLRALNQATDTITRSRRLRQARLDGLGDRDRSLSPDGGATWDTLLTSITPDPQAPSAGSSFASTSAAAAAASSSSSAPTSASTSMTSVDLTDLILPDCEDSDPDTEDEDEDVYELRNLRRSRAWRTYADVANLPTDAENLGDMRQIISRLAANDDIPDEFWASAGLSRTLRREPTA